MLSTEAGDRQMLSTVTVGGVETLDNCKRRQGDGRSALQ